MDAGKLPEGEEARMGTLFAPPGRVSQEEIAAQAESVVNHPVIRAVLQSFGGHVLVLNPERQILAASPEFKEGLAQAGIHDFVGMRPGEALDCEHAQEGPGGCGTSLDCRHCGAVLAILLAQSAQRSSDEECWLSMRQNHRMKAIEFHVKATPLTLGPNELVVLALHEISDRKRREALERSFLHDARNLLSGILTWSEVLQQDRPDESSRSIGELALQLRALFAQHAVLADAEKGLLVVEKAPLDVAALAHALSESCAYQPSGAGRNLVVRFPSSSPPVTTDFNLVLRILTNMVTNALEAAPSGTTVQVGYQGGEGEVVFSVHNQGAIPEDVAERIFQRSFSTKTESGHGLGTYSMRLLAENYLGGRVNFTSSPAEGTTFRLHLPT